jgi:hypothetical protein
MLRNIPNKVDQAMLKRIIDESSWGKYDFMYLRIDFANDCKYVETQPFDARFNLLTVSPSVGYAFINFVDVSHLTRIVLESSLLTLSSLWTSSMYVAARITFFVLSQLLMISDLKLVRQCSR